MKKIQKGFTIAELLLTVGIVGLSASAIYVLHDVTNNSNEAFQETQRLTNYSSIAESAIATNGNYSDVNIEFLENYGIIVDKKNGFDNVLSHTPSSLSFTYKGVSSNFCSKFLTNILTSNSRFNIKINDVEINKKTDYIADIASGCSVGNVNLEFTQNALLTTGTLTPESNIPAYTYETGNPISLMHKNLNALSPIEVISGQTYSSEPALLSNLTGAGFTFNGVIQNPGTSPLPPNYNSPPSDYISAGPDVELPPTTVPENVTMTSSASFKIDTWGVINVYSTQMKVDIQGLLPLKSYRLEFVSSAFGLVSNNPVKLGTMSDSNSLIDELSVVVKTNKNGDASFFTTSPIDVSDYFRESKGVDSNNKPITNPNEPMNSSLEFYFQNTIKNYPMTVDIVSMDNEKIVKSLDFRPEWYITSPFIEMLRSYGEGTKSLLNGYSFTVVCKGTVNNCRGYNSDLSTGVPLDIAKPKKDVWSFKAPIQKNKPSGSINFKTKNDWIDFTGEGFRIYFANFTRSGNPGNYTYTYYYTICKLPSYGVLSYDNSSVYCSN